MSYRVSVRYRMVAIDAAHEEIGRSYWRAVFQAERSFGGGEP